MIRIGRGDRKGEGGAEPDLDEREGGDGGCSVIWLSWESDTVD